MTWKKTERFKPTEFGPMSAGHTIETTHCPTCDAKPAAQGAEWRSEGCAKCGGAYHMADQCEAPSTPPAPREWYINPIAGYRCEVNENSIGLTGNEIHVVEASALTALQAKCDRWREQAEALAHVLESVRSQMCWDRDRDQLTMGMTDLHDGVTQALAAFKSSSAGRA